eukprot:5462129-Prymnesium_polylepis.1
MKPPKVLHILGARLPCRLPTRHTPTNYSSTRQTARSPIAPGRNPPRITKTGTSPKGATPAARPPQGR